MKGTNGTMFNWLRIKRKPPDERDGAYPFPQRYAVRLRLLKAGLRRVNFTRDHGDGAYSEQWKGRLGSITIRWNPRPR